MIFDLDDLLNEVDKWKFKLHDKLKAMTEAEEAAFWKEVKERWDARQAKRAQQKKRRKKPAGRS